MATMSKQPNLDCVPLQDLVADNVEGVDVNYIKKFSSNDYGKITIMGILDHLLARTLMAAGHRMYPTPLMQVETMSQMI
jgi:hypothetical protein